MSKPILFNTKEEKVIEINPLKNERELQKIVEKNMKKIFQVDFLQSEYAFVDQDHGRGRIDSIGIDENNRPIIFEYKFKNDENVINQALFYMEWLMNHKADFQLLVIEKYGKDRSDEIKWFPRAICIANDFDKYSDHAVYQMNVDISLIKYYPYGENNQIIAFENINKKIEENKSPNKIVINKKIEFNERRKYENEYYQKIYDSLNNEQKYLIDNISLKIESISDDVSSLTLKRYKAFRRINNFATLVIKRSGECSIYLKIDFIEEYSEIKSIRDVKNIGHWGTGNIEIKLQSIEEFDSIFHLIKKSYQEN